MIKLMSPSTIPYEEQNRNDLVELLLSLTVSFISVAYSFWRLFLLACFLLLFCHYKVHNSWVVVKLLLLSLTVAFTSSASTDLFSLTHIGPITLSMYWRSSAGMNGNMDFRSFLFSMLRLCRSVMIAGIFNTAEFAILLRARLRLFLSSHLQTIVYTWSSDVHLTVHTVVP